MNGDQPKIRIATIGAWGHLGRVLAEFDGEADCRITAMAPMPEEPVDRYRKAHPSAQDSQVFDDPRRMLDEVKPHVVVISTRPDRIAPLATEAAERGCHLICEKPLAIDHVSLRRLWDTCQNNGVRCIAILDNHVDPVVAAASQAVRGGLVGDVAMVNTRKSYKWGTRPQWFGRRAIYGGTIPWIGIHALDFVYSITGEQFETVAAMQSNRAHPEFAECEDNAALLVKLRGGGHATASLDLLRPSAADTHGDDWFRVVGSAGVLEGYITRHRCTVTAANQPERELPLRPKGQAFVPFIHSLATPTADVHPDMRRAFVLTHASLCARDAADRGQIVRIDAAAWI